MRILGWVFCCLMLSVASAQKMTPQEYIDTYKQIAIDEMVRVGVPASITLAQGLLETENGNSDLVHRSNNHFGIKCKNTWTGEKVYHDDDASGECFRKYNTAAESYKDHSDFLKGRPPYQFLFSIDPTDYKSWARGLKKAGYATNPKYPEMLIKHIEDFDLNQYTLAGLAAMQGAQPTTPAGIDTSTNIITTAVQSIKGIKAVYAQKGTSWLAIAVQHQIDLEQLLLYNNQSKDGILQENKWVYLESATHVSVVEKIFKKRKGKSREQFHEVKPKEGLYGIAKKYNVSVSNIKKWNHLQSDDLKVGQQLIISK